MAAVLQYGAEVQSSRAVRGSVFSPDGGPSAAQTCRRSASSGRAALTTFAPTHALTLAPTPLHWHAAESEPTRLVEPIASRY